MFFKKAAMKFEKTCARLVVYMLYLTMCCCGLQQYCMSFPFNPTLDPIEAVHRAFDCMACRILPTWLVSRAASPSGIPSCAPTHQFAKYVAPYPKSPIRHCTHVDVPRP